MKAERGFTLIELIVVVGVVAVLSALAVAQVMRARIASNESAALSGMRAIGSAQVSYANGCGRGAFATDLTTLGVPAPGTSVPFLSPDLTAAAVVAKSGYGTTLAAGAGAAAAGPDCNGTVAFTTYYASTIPLAYGVSGYRSFATNAGGTIWQLYGAVAPLEPFAAPATPIQ